jgi:hypothetical protein
MFNGTGQPMYSGKLPKWAKSLAKTTTINGYTREEWKTMKKNPSVLARFKNVMTMNPDVIAAFFQEWDMAQDQASKADDDKRAPYFNNFRAIILMFEARGCLLRELNETDVAEPPLPITKKEEETI